MCGGGGGLFKSLFGAVGSLFGLGQKQKVVEAKTPQAPIVDTASDTASLDAAQAQKKKRAMANGMSSNLLAGDTTGTTTATHSLLGD